VKLLPHSGFAQTFSSAGGSDWPHVGQLSLPPIVPHDLTVLSVTQDRVTPVSVAGFPPCHREMSLQRPIWVETLCLLPI
jgi:hypothetical protein